MRAGQSISRRTTGSRIYPSVIALHSLGIQLTNTHAPQHNAPEEVEAREGKDDAKLEVEDAVPPVVEVAVLGAQVRVRKQRGDEDADDEEGDEEGEGEELEGQRVGEPDRVHHPPRVEDGRGSFRQVDEHGVEGRDHVVRLRG